MAAAALAVAAASPAARSARQAVTDEPAAATPQAAAPIPTRIVIIAPNAAEILCALGMGDAIVGVDKFCVFPPELNSRPRVGGLFDPDLEKIIALRPDLVVLRGRNHEVERLCQSSGIRLYHDPTEGFDDIGRCIRELGEIVGRPRQAQSLIDRFDAGMGAVRQRVQRALGDGRPPRVLITLARDPQEMGDIFTAGRGTYVDEMIRIAGGVNVYGEMEMAYPTVTPEDVLARQPEVIIELMPEVRLTDALRAALLAQWKSVGPLPAAANRRVYFVGDEYPHALIPSPRYVEIVEMVSKLLHPGAMPTPAGAGMSSE